MQVILSQAVAPTQFTSLRLPVARLLLVSFSSLALSTSIAFTCDSVTLLCDSNKHALRLTGFQNLRISGTISGFSSTVICKPTHRFLRDFCEPSRPVHHCSSFHVRTVV